MTADFRRGTFGPLPLHEVTPDGSFTALLASRNLLPTWDLGEAGEAMDLPEATTVVALRWPDGVVMAGDRRATAGNLIAHHRVKKVYAADDYSAIAISGTAGMAVELTRLFQTELEHYEKIEGIRLSLDGKANFLARLVRANLPLAFQGLFVVPLFAGYDVEEEAGKLYSFDAIGGRYEEQDYASTGSGGFEAKAFLKSAWRPDVDEERSVSLAVEALVAAAEEDSATGGPDLKRGILPNVVTVTATGLTELPDDRLTEVASAVLEARP